MGVDSRVRPRGAEVFELITGQKRVLAAHRWGEHLIVEAELRRGGRPFPVPFVLAYRTGFDGEPALLDAHAGAGAVVLDGDGYLFLADANDTDRLAGHGGRVLRRRFPDRTETVLGTARGLMSYAAAAGAVVAAAWADPDSPSIEADDEAYARWQSSGELAAFPTAAGWPHLGHRPDNATLRLLVRPGHAAGAGSRTQLAEAGSPAELRRPESRRLESRRPESRRLELCGLELCRLELEPGVELSGEVALTPDGRRGVAGLVRTLADGNRRFGLYLFALREAGAGAAYWKAGVDLSAPVPSPDGSWFACTAERVSTPGLAPHRGVFLLSPDGGRTLDVTDVHDDWLEPRAWHDGDVLCSGAVDGHRRLWRMSAASGAITLLDVEGSVASVTVRGDEALVVRSAVDCPPEVVALKLDDVDVCIDMLTASSRQLLMQSTCAAREADAAEVVYAPAAAARPTGRLERQVWHDENGTPWRAWLCLPGDAGPHDGQAQDGPGDAGRRGRHAQGGPGDGGLRGGQVDDGPNNGRAQEEEGFGDGGARDAQVHERLGEGRPRAGRVPEGPGAGPAHEGRIPAGRGEPLPVLVWCHGGPLLSWTDWSWRWNPWPFVADGHAVLMIDPPLSLGYGKQSIARGWGHWLTEVARVAVGQVRGLIAADPRLDGSRIATMGASFGGWLSIALATLMPEVRLVAAHAGWADVAGVARTCDLNWHWLREYGPPSGPNYARETPQLDDIHPSCRLLLSHGVQDGHVPVHEVFGVQRALTTRGVDVRLMILPDEGHSIRRPANAAAWFRWVRQACTDTWGRPVR